MSGGADSDESTAQVTPMFPLGTVLLPTMVLPLHVFEQRYRTMLDDVLSATEPEFGVVLIERGSEVGGGDTRTSIGCMARVLEASRAEDGRWGLITMGVRRIAVQEWLADDPYPRALVRESPDLADWPEEDSPPDRADRPHASVRLDALVARVRRLLALASELGAEVPSVGELSEDPGLCTYQLAVLSPIGSLDRMRVLRCPGPGARLALLEELVSEQEELIDARLAFGGEPPNPA